MTDDAVAVLDALGWERAHVFGASLGGVIAQRIALRHPDRVASVVSAMAIPSDVSGIGGGRYVRFGLLARLARARFPEGREGDIQLSLMLARELASPAYPFDENAAREWIGRDVDSGPRDTKAQSRQVGAPWHGPKLRELRKPVLVLHGDQDPILRVSAARATARAIDGTRLVILPGVGHDLPAPLWPQIADEVRQLADRPVPRPAKRVLPAAWRQEPRAGAGTACSPAYFSCGTTTTGQAACSTTWLLTEPSISRLNPPPPREPTTTRSAPCDASTSSLAGKP